MKFHAERLTGSNMFAHFYAALPGQSEADTAAFLCITAPTLRRYLTGKSEPPAPLVSLLWHESAHGRAALDEHAHRGMLYARGEAQSLQAANAALRARIAALEAEIDSVRAAYAENRPRLVAANASTYRVA